MTSNVNIMTLGRQSMITDDNGIGIGTWVWWLTSFFSCFFFSLVLNVIYDGRYMKYDLINRLYTLLLSTFLETYGLWLLEQHVCLVQSAALNTQEVSMICHASRSCHVCFKRHGINFLAQCIPTFFIAKASTAFHFQFFSLPCVACVKEATILIQHVYRTSHLACVCHS